MNANSIPRISEEIIIIFIGEDQLSCGHFKMWNSHHWKKQTQINFKEVFKINSNVLD